MSTYTYHCTNCAVASANTTSSKSSSVNLQNYFKGFEGFLPLIILLTQSQQNYSKGVLVWQIAIGFRGTLCERPGLGLLDMSLFLLYLYSERI